MLPAQLGSGCHRANDIERGPGVFVPDSLAPAGSAEWVERDGGGRAGTREAIILTVSHPTLSDPYPWEAPDPTFAELGVREEIVQTLRAVGIERTFPIQKLTLPLALAGEDLIGQARTGTGKTLGFGVPVLQRISSGDIALDGTPRALVVVPTRELYLQVSADLTAAGRNLGVRVLAVYGGRPYEGQVKALTRGVDLVVGTPGRLLDLADQRHLVLGKVRILVLDEADEMLDLGFLPDIERMLRMVPQQRQTMLFSATMPAPIITLARTFLTQPTHIRAEQPDATAIHERTRQFVYRAHAMDKVELLARMLQSRNRGLTMIFTRTKRTAQKVADELAERGFAVASVHGDLGQPARERALRAFRAEKVDVLVATDVAARGLDVPEVTHVINYQCPEDEKTYVHRIGRTGRAGRAGIAVTLVDWDEEPRWRSISDMLDLHLPTPSETYSTSDHLFRDLDIPTDSTGRLPLARRTRAELIAELSDTDDRNRGRRAAEHRRSPHGGAADSQLSPVRRLRRRTRGARAPGVIVETMIETVVPAEQAQARPLRRRHRSRGGGPEHGSQPRAAG